jgi:hypothetical protein
MHIEAFRQSAKTDTPPENLSAPLEALWWDAKGNWSRAHELVDHLESPEGMAVHAYLHRKEGEQWNADYWYRRAGRQYRRNDLKDEWKALVEGLLKGD